MLGARPLIRNSLIVSSRSVMAANASRMVYGAIRPHINYRPLTTIKTTAEEAEALLIKQRSNRPNAPHLEIWKPQLPFVMSGAHRVTGVALAGGLYAFLLAYLAGPAVGIPLDSAALASSFGSLPLIVKIGAKAIAAFPFTYHAFNGVRHLIWDTASELTLKGVYRTGYVVLGLTTVSTLILAII